MIKSMTGYGRSQVSSGNYMIICEIKGVNHKFSHFHLHLERQFSFLELEIRKLLKERIARGRVDLFLEVNEVQIPSDKIRVNRSVLEKYIKIFKEVREEFQLAGDLSWETFAVLPEVITIQEETRELEDLQEIILDTVSQALKAFMSMREKEGVRLQNDIEDQLNRLKTHLAAIEARLPEMILEYRSNLRERIEQVLEKRILDEERLLEEIAYFMERSNINEEIVRMKSHIRQFEDTLTAKKPVGRKLDFIAQELYREANTIGSKTPDAAVGNRVVEMKTVIDKIREQIQNIE